MAVSALSIRLAERARIQLASPQLGNRFFMSDCVPEWAEPSTRVKHHRLFTTNIAREDPDAKTCERQGSFQEGVSLMLTWVSSS